MRRPLIVGTLVLASLVAGFASSPARFDARPGEATAAFVAVPAVGVSSAALRPVADRPDAEPAAPPPLPFWPAPDPLADTTDQGTGNEDVLPEAAAPQPSTPVAEPAPAAWTSGPPVMSSNAVILSAGSLLGIRYVWGGNTTDGLDCSAYVSRAWGITRQTTDTLHNFAMPIAKDDLMPGDIMNLTKAQDPRGYGHVRIFAAWADADHTRIWVYEETPPKSVYHVIAYDPRYTPMRRTNVQVDGVNAPLIEAPLPTARPSRVSRRGEATDRSTVVSTEATQISSPAHTSGGRRSGVWAPQPAPSSESVPALAIVWALPADQPFESREDARRRSPSSTARRSAPTPTPALAPALPADSALAPREDVRERSRLGTAPRPTPTPELALTPAFPADSTPVSREDARRRSRLRSAPRPTPTPEPAQTSEPSSTTDGVSASAVDAPPEPIVARAPRRQRLRAGATWGVPAATPATSTPASTPAAVADATTDAVADAPTDTATEPAIDPATDATTDTAAEPATDGAAAIVAAADVVATPTVGGERGDTRLLKARLRVPGSAKRHGSARAAVTTSTAAPAPVAVTPVVTSPEQAAAPAPSSPTRVARTAGTRGRESAPARSSSGRLPR